MENINKFLSDRNPSQTFTTIRSNKEIMCNQGTMYTSQKIFIISREIRINIDQTLLNSNLAIGTTFITIKDSILDRFLLNTIPWINKPRIKGIINITIDNLWIIREVTQGLFNKETHIPQIIMSKLDLSKQRIILTFNFL